MGRVLATIATILIIVLGAAFIAPALIDWESLRSPLEDAASTALGRKITTQGKIDITLLPELRVRLGQVTAAGNGGKPQTALVTAEAVDVVLSLQALLAGQIEANNVKLLRPSLQLNLSRSKPRGSKNLADESALPLPAEVHNLEIEDGRLVIFANELASGKPVSFEKINGALSSPAGTDSYRFGGRFTFNGKPFDIKFLASSESDRGVRLSGAIADPVSKSTLQGDGMLSAPDGPVFEGTVSVNRTPGSEPDIQKQVQVKSTAKIDLKGISLTNLAITIDPENRPQILMGSGNIAFASNAASFLLQARSFDADALLSGGGNNFETANPQSDWSAFIGAANKLLWFYPETALRLSLAIDQAQMRGELIENVKLDSERTGNRWVFEKLLGLLPGDTALKVVGAIEGKDGSPKVSGVVSADGKNLGRLARWFAPAASEVKKFPARPFTIKGSMTLSDEVAAFEGVTGSIGDTPFNASLHLDKGSDSKLFLSLSGESFDLGGLDFDQEGTPDNLSEWRASLSRVFPSLAGYSERLAAADVDISIGKVKTSAIEVRNLAARAKLSPDMLAISKLSIETPEGLTVSGEGVFPLKGGSQGKFEGRLDAQSAEALRQMAKFAGYDSIGGRKIEDFAPAAITFSSVAKAEAEDFSVKSAGNLGGTHFEGRGQLRGGLSEWKSAPLSIQFDASAPNGNQLLSQLFPQARSAPPIAQSPGTLSLRLNGKPDRLETALTVKAPLLQLQLDGATYLKDGSVAFTGKGSATSLTPDVFLPAPVLALIGGDAPSNLRVEANLSLTPNRAQADKIKAETAQNTATGSLTVDASGSTARLEAELSSDRLSLPNMMNYFLAPPDAGKLVSSIANAVTSGNMNEWPDRPFALSVFRNASARIILNAKTLKISDAVAVTDSQIAARLENGRLEIQKLEGKTFGGELNASLALEASGGSVAATSRISLTNIDLASVPKDTKPPLLAGRGAVALSVSGQGLSPRGLVAVVAGDGHIEVSDGQISKLSPMAVQKAGDEMLANPQPLTEDEIVKRSLKAAESGDFKFRRLTIPVVIQDGVVEIKHASFENRDGAIRLEAYLDLSKMQIDGTWLLDAPADSKAKWPPVKLASAGPLRELGGRPQSISAEDFARALIVKKMEGDITRLEGLNKPRAASPWTTLQESIDKASGQKKNAKTSSDNEQPAERAAPLPNKIPSSFPTSDFERRMRDALQAQDAANADPRTRRAP